MPSLNPATVAAAIVGFVVGSLIAIRKTRKIEKEMSLTKATLLQALALIAAAQATAQTEREKSAQLANRVAEFKEDHDLVNDQEVNDALSRVLQAATEAPVNASATAANAALEDFLDTDNDGKDDRTGKSRSDNPRESDGRPVPPANFDADGNPIPDGRAGATPPPQSPAPTGEGTPSPNPEGNAEGTAPQNG